MLNFWRLELEASDDFLLVESPSFAIAHVIRAYHLELLSRVRALPNYENDDKDSVFFRVLAPCYEKISSRLLPSHNASQLNSSSRHKFFIAAELRGEYWISGLELLMGYDFQISNPKASTLQVTSGNSEIDLLAELLLIPESNNILKWLIEKKSPQYLWSLVKQISDRRRGKEALDELQRFQDLNACEASMEEMRVAGFIIPEG